MYKALNINFDILAKTNNKGHLVEYFPFLVNKSITIAAHDRETNDICVDAGVVIGYSYNSSTINETGVCCCVTAIG